MALTNANHKLPIVTLDSDVIGTRELQKVSGAYLQSLKSSGPKIVSVGSVKRAVLVEYDQYMRFQKLFKEALKNMSIINQGLRKGADGHKLQGEELQLLISGTLKKIVEESPTASPFADLMDAILGVAAGLEEGESEPAPLELKSRVQQMTTANAKKVTKRRARPKRNLTE